jgi:NADH-quinone oxidoreductase subunit B
MAETYTSKLDEAIRWAQKYSLISYPFATACCAMEYFATIASKYDIARFGAEIPRFTPRQADLLFVIAPSSRNRPRCCAASGNRWRSPSG